MATTLLTLSDELLLQIVKHLSHSKRSLLALIRTCRRISLIARDALYQDVEVHLPEYDTTAPRHASLGRRELSAAIRPCRLVRLLHIWHEKPILLIQTLKNLTIHGSHRTRFRSELAWLLGDLVKAKGLQSLTLSSCTSHHIEAFIPVFQSPARTTHPVLKRLHIRNHQDEYHSPIISALLLVCAHCPVHEIRIDSAIGVYCSALYPCVPPMRPERSSTRSLITGPLISAYTLELILSSAPNLERIETHIPDDHVRNRVNSVGDSSGRIILKPRQLGQHLSLVRQTLRHLKITSPGPVVSEYDRTHVDFSAFSCLEDLQISSVLLLGNVSYMSKVSTVDLVSLLPLSLKRLFLSFDTLQGIFHSNVDLSNTTYEYPTPVTRKWAELWREGPGNPYVIREGFDWLHNLSNKCKRLQQLTLEETHDKSALVRKKEGRMEKHTPESFLSIDVAPYHASFFAHFPFQCKVSVYMDFEWWAFAKQCPCWTLVSTNPARLPWIELDDM